MHILLVNDDGVHAKGIRALAEALAPYHRVTVIAPEHQQSAQSHALTIEAPIRMHEWSEKGANPLYLSLTGTPTDCVKFAMSFYLKEDKPDLLISGINAGLNVGSDVLYSGTVSAAMEGLYYDIPCWALSVDKLSDERLEEIMPFILEYLQKVFIDGQFIGLLNMNFPAKGPCTWDNCKVCVQGMEYYDEIIEDCVDRKGDHYYWIGGTHRYDKTATQTDVTSIRQGNITVTPLTWRQDDNFGHEQLFHILYRD